jgi:hypothetical protein
MMYFVKIYQLPKRKGRHSLRSESAVLLEVPRVRHSTIGGRAFAFTAIICYNINADWHTFFLEAIVFPLF